MSAFGSHLSGGNILLEGPSGHRKTLPNQAKSIRDLHQISLLRPLPSDITGFKFYDMRRVIPLQQGPV